jgi:hypothetical protein
VTMVMPVAKLPRALRKLRASKFIAMERPRQVRIGR